MAEEIAYWPLTPEPTDRLTGADVFDFAVKPDQLAAFVADPGHVMFCASLGDRVVGFASGTILLHPDKAAALFVNEVAVAEPHRQRGIATALMDRLLEWARARGCGVSWLATEADNPAAKALYRRLGGRETSGLVMYEWDGATGRHGGDVSEN